MGHICITVRNWRPIVIASILTASKVWDDLSSWNIEFSNLLPLLSLPSINKLEGIYLQSLQYDLYISSSEYARYYFALRSVKSTKTQHIARYYLNTKSATKRKTSTGLELDLNVSLSRRTKGFEKKSVMNHAQSIQLKEQSNECSKSMMDEVKYDTEEQAQSIVSSSDSSNLSVGMALHSVNVIEEEQELQDDDINRSKAMLLTQSNKKTKSKHLSSFSMPSKIQSLRPIN